MIEATRAPRNGAHDDRCGHDTRRTLIRGARQLVTLRGSGGFRRGSTLRDLGIIEDGAVLIEGARIREVGPTRRLENLADAAGADEIDAGGRVVIPGFVDCHAHLISGARGYAFPPGEGPGAILPWVNSVRDAPGPLLRSRAEAKLKRCCAHGTTAMGALSGFGLSDAAELKIMRVYGSLVQSPVEIVPSFFAIHELPPEFAGRRDEFIAHIGDELLPTVERRGLARFVQLSCGVGAFTASECARIIEKLSSKFLVRMDYAAHGRSDSLAPLLGDKICSVDHLEHATADDLLALAASPSAAVLLPSNSSSWSGRGADARFLADAGAAIALGSDLNNATAPGGSMQAAVYLACRNLKLTVAEALTGATINAACVLGLGDRLGSLEPGKQADLLILQAADHRALAHEFGINLIDMTMKGGHVVYQAAGVS